MTTRRDVALRSWSEPTTPPGRSMIATIGIDRYQHWQRLANAVRDATRTAELFAQLGFEPLRAPLLDHDATGNAIRSLVTSDLRKLGPNDSLVLFFAGHGATYGHRPGGQEIKAGYLIPADASSSPDDLSTWVDLDSWLRAVALLPAKHILVIVDACRSGIALDGIIQRHRGAEPAHREASPALQARRSRRIITSALSDQTALDSGPRHGHSLFTGCLIEALTCDLRHQGAQTTTGSKLGMYLQQRVDAHTSSQQTPDFGSFYHDDRGEISIPVIDAADRSLPPLAADDSSLELAPWNAPGRPASRPLEPRLEYPMVPVTYVAAQESTGVPQEPPVDHEELARVVHRLEREVLASQRAMNGFGLFCFVGAAIASVTALKLKDDGARLGVEWAVVVAVICSLLLLYARVREIVVLSQMRQVVGAVREAPERIVLICHSPITRIIEIHTPHERIVVEDGPELFGALVRRCPTAQIKIR